MEVVIESIAAGGDGVARADGLVVFVPRTAPGDVAEIEIEPRGRFARGVLRQLRTPSPDRVTPRCPHYDGDRCGGCQLQHLAYAAQLTAKSRIVADALRRIGRRDVRTPVVHASPDEWGYRRKLTLALRRQGGAWVAGLHRYDAPDRVFALRECPIAHDDVLAVWREVMGASDALPEAARLRGAVRVDARRASLVLEGGGRWPRLDEFLARVPGVDAVWWQAEGGPLAPVRERARDAGAAPGASFAQVNPRVAAHLQRHVLERVRAHGPRAVVDAYAGLGDTAAALAAEGCRVTAIELDAAAAAWCAERLSHPSRAIAGRVEDALPAALPADVVILNPPRAGVDRRVTATLAAAAPAPRAILYVSCDPATLARDVARLAGWRIASLAAFDMFPQTAHVECVCELLPERA